MLKLLYTVDVDITSQKLDISRLHAEIEASGYPVNGITLSGDNFEISFEDELTPSAVINIIVLGHSGEQLPKFKFHASSPLVQDEVIITQKNEWQILAGVFVNPSFFMDDMSKAISAFTGTVKHQGLTFELRIVEVQPDGTTKVMTMPCDHGMDDNKDWHTFEMFNYLPPSMGENIYQFEGRLNDSVSASVRFCNISLLENLRV